MPLSSAQGPMALWTDGGLLYLAASFALAFVLMDALLYYMHRAMHCKAPPPAHVRVLTPCTARTPY